MRILFFLFFTLGLCYSLQAATKVYSKGLKLSKPEGLIRIVDKNKKELKALEGLVVRPGTFLYTGPNSKLTLLADSGDRYQLGANSTLMISEPIRDRFKAALAPKPTSRDDTLRFIKGKLDAFVKPGAPDRVRISTSLSVLSVKGTTFRVTYDNRMVKLEVFKGIVEMESFAGEKVEVLAGMQADTSSWQARKIDRDAQRKLEIEVIEEEKGSSSQQGRFDESFNDFGPASRPTPDVYRNEDAVFNWSTFDLEIEINHPARNPSHQRSNSINVLPPTPPSR